MDEINSNFTQIIIDKFFDDNPNILVKHQLDSYNDFFFNGIKNILKEKNPIKILKDQDLTTNEFNLKCNIYIGGKNGDLIYYGKPIIFDENREHFMYPNEARLRNMTYGITIHYDVLFEIFIKKSSETDSIKDIQDVTNDDIEQKIATEVLGTELKGGGKNDSDRDIDDEDEDELVIKKTKKISDTKKENISTKNKKQSSSSRDKESDMGNDSNEDEDESELPSYTFTLEKIYLGRFPIMLQSDLCLLNKLPRHLRYELGECKNDYGGYFIINGNEKCIVSQEKFADNMLYLRDNINDTYSCGADIRSVSEDASKPVRTFSIRMVKANAKKSNNHIVVNVPNVRKPVPLFILMRALGVLSDKEIIKYCLLDLEKYESYMELFIPSIHDANRFFSQTVCLKYISTFTKSKTIAHVLDILSNYMLPHIGEMNFKNKAFYIGYMVKEMLKVHKKVIKPTDRDHFKYKRVEPPGKLLYDLFKEYYTHQQTNLFKKIDNEYYYKQSLYKNNFIGLFKLNSKEFFSDRIVETGFKKAFNGNWGAEEHTRKDGVVQEFNRLTYNSAISHLRKINLPLDASAKVTGPRLLHSSQWGIIDPVDTPDGGNVGLHKHMAISAHITSGHSSFPLINWLRLHRNLLLLEECTPDKIVYSCKILINGNWVGIVNNPKELLDNFKKYRRAALISIYTSINWNINDNLIEIYTDSGRLCRPIFYIENKNPSFNKERILKKINTNEFSWLELLTGFKEKTDKDFDINKSNIYFNITNLYSSITNIDDLNNYKSVIEYMDSSEEESSLIKFNDNVTIENHTHIEIHPSFMFGVMGNQVVFPENNQLPRDLFACGQMRQAVSLYHSNYQSRIDKMGVVLNYGQIPLVKSRYLSKINNEEHPYGENVICAIMCYGGYNVEDSILFNEASVNRGLFRTTYYNSYEAYEESSNVAGNKIDTKFVNLESENVVGIKPGFSYSDLNEHGLIKENTQLDDKKVIIGKITKSASNSIVSADSSVYPKKGQLGFVDKTFITEGNEGYRIAKVRVRDERIPAIGDKFCSRCGQKGTIGLIIPEEDMPFDEFGIRPDIIINPHAIPSRMTIGQLVETIMGKACSVYGGFGDCTAFMNKGQKHKIFGDLLQSIGFNSKSHQILYNGQTGEQLETDIFIGPTYYMRLKHMVKDKINHRARGPKTVLTRQTVGGRANDGGLRIGEMERDGVICHGATQFLKESMLTRGDEYYMAICNLTGMVAIYNDSKDLYFSLYADGPIKFNGNLDTNMNIENVSVYGKSFSIIRIPYAFKLLIQELQTMNIQMRLITDSNIDQLSNMAFSNNINKLFNDDEITPAKIVQNTMNSINKLQSTEMQAKGVSLSGIDKDIDAKSDEYNTIASEISINLQEEKDKEKTPIDYGWILKESSDNNQVWVSIIKSDYDGKETSLWNNSEHDFLPPNGYPSGWNESEAVYYDGTKISPEKIIEKLQLYSEPGNWTKSLNILKTEYRNNQEELKKVQQEEIEKQNSISNPNSNYNPNSNSSFNTMDLLKSIPSQITNFTNKTQKQFDEVVDDANKFIDESKQTITDGYNKLSTKQDVVIGNDVNLNSNEITLLTNIENNDNNNDNDDESDDKKNITDNLNENNKKKTITIN